MGLEISVTSLYSGHKDSFVHSINTQIRKGTRQTTQHLLYIHMET